MKKRILMTGTGGHFNAALAVMEELSKKKEWQLYWIGAKSAFERQPQVPTFESQILPRMGIPFWDITTGKLQRGRFFETLFSLSKLPVGFLQSLLILVKIRPHLVLSFGGYVSIPVCFTAWVLGIPIIVHEQTTTSGFANRLVAKVARRIAVSHKDSIRDFASEKTILVGNPVRRSIFRAARERRAREEEQRTLIYATGGSRGSGIINNAVFQALPQILKLGDLYHQTGVLDFKKSQDLKKRLPRSLKEKYHPSVIFTPDEVNKIYREASLVISRAGANTVSELEVLQIPSLLIPIPWVEKDEQRKNAQILERAGAGVILEQSRLSGETLLEMVSKIINQSPKPGKYSKAELALPGAAKRLVHLVKDAVNGDKN